MGNRNKRYIKRVVISILGFTAVLSAGWLGGSYSQKYRQVKAAESKEQVNRIAVVNMDSGVDTGVDHINYADRLMQMPADYFVAAGLNEAKLGIGNGTYAAYIVIPESFSQSVLSVEGEPQKIVLEYAFNQKLDDETRGRAVDDIHMFETTLNTNLAYIYIDAIFEAFHGVQDDASDILVNDASELEQLLGVKAESLIAAVEQTEIQRMDDMAQTVELNPYFAQNSELLTSMTGEFQSFVTQGMDGFAAVQSGHQTVNEASEQFFSLYGTVLTDTAISYSAIAAEGRAELEKTIGLFNEDADQDVAAMRAQISALVEAQRLEDMRSANRQSEAELADVELEYEEELSHVQRTWEEAYEIWDRYAADASIQKGGELRAGWQSEIDASLPQMLMLAYKQGTEEAVATVEEAVTGCIPDGEEGNTTPDSGVQGGVTVPTVGTDAAAVVLAGTGADAGGSLGNSGNGGDSAGSGGNTGGSAENSGNGGDSAGSSGNTGGSTGNSGNGGDSAGNSGNTGGSTGNPGNGGDSAGNGGTPDGSYTSEEILKVCTEIRADLDARAEEYLVDAKEDVKIELSEAKPDDLLIRLEEAQDAKGKPVVPPVLEKKDDEETSGAHIVLGTSDHAGKAAVSETAEVFAGMFKLEEERYAISDVIQTGFVEKLIEEGQSQMERLSSSERRLGTVMEDYERSLQTYDPFLYYREESMASYLDDIADNASDMLAEVEESHTQSMTYVDEVYTKAAEDVDKMQQAYDYAEAITAENVESCIRTLQDSRENVNDRNTAMLEEFSLLLPNTRGGSQPNPKVYEHIVNPIVAAEHGGGSTERTLPAEASQLTTSDVIMWTLIGGIVCCIIFIIFSVFRRVRRTGENQENNFV